MRLFICSLFGAEQKNEQQISLFTPATSQSQGNRVGNFCIDFVSFFLFPEISGVDQYSYRGFARALESIAIALAENSGLNQIETLSEIKRLQVEENNPHLGVDCNQNGTCDMKQQKVTRLFCFFAFKQTRLFL